MESTAPVDGPAFLFGEDDVPDAPADGLLREFARMLEVVATNFSGLALVLRGEGSPEHSEDLRAQVDEIRNVIAALTRRGE